MTYLYDERKYDRIAISHYEIVAAFLTDAFYNGLYDLAAGRYESGKAQTITDAFKEIVVSYSRGVREHKHYATILGRLRDYYQQHTMFKHITLSDFQSKMLEYFIPNTYLSSYSSRERDSTLMKIITKTVGDFACYVLRPSNIELVIDKRDEYLTHTEGFKEFIRQMLIEQREAFHTMFYEQHVSHQQTVPKAVYDKVQAELCAARKEVERMRTVVDEHRDTKFDNTETAKERDEARADAARACQLVAQLTADGERITNAAHALERQVAEQSRELVKLRDDRVRLMDMVKQLLSRGGVPEPKNTQPVGATPVVSNQPASVTVVSTPRVISAPSTQQPTQQPKFTQPIDQYPDQDEEQEDDEEESDYEKMRMERLARNRSLQAQPQVVQPKVELMQDDVDIHSQVDITENVDSAHDELFPIPSRDDIMSFMVDDPGWGS